MAAGLSALAGKAPLYRALGTLYLRESNADAAVRAFSSLVRITPNDASAHRERGQALLLQGRQDEAFIEFVAPLQSEQESRRTWPSGRCILPRHGIRMPCPFSNGPSP